MNPTIDDVRWHSGIIGDRANTEQPIDATDDAADDAADKAPDRPRSLTTDISPMRDSVRNALRLGRKRTSHRRSNDARKHDL